MIRVLVSTAQAEALQRVLEQHGIDTEMETAKDDADQLLAEFARVPADILILDADTGLTETAVQRYKLAKPDVRIILLAVGREPGDAQVARIVASRVDDVVTDLDRLPVALLKPASYHDTLRWLAPHVVDPETRPGKVAEKIIVRKVASTTRPVVIVVNSYAHAAGCTTCAVSVAAYLSNRGHTVALAETVSGGDAGVLRYFVNAPEPLVGARWQPGLKVWTIADDADIRNIIAQRESEYVVIDDGMEYTPLAQNIADLKIVAVPDCSWRLRDLTVFRDRICGHPLPDGQTLDFTQFTLVVCGAGRPITKKVLDAARDEFPVSYLGNVDLDEGLHVIAQTVGGCVGLLLEPFLPDTAPKVPWFRKLRLPARKRRPPQASAPTPAPKPGASVAKPLAILSAGFWRGVELVLPWLIMLLFAAFIVKVALDPSVRAWLSNLVTALLARLGLT